MASPLLNALQRAKVASFVLQVARQTLQCRADHKCHIWPFEHGGLLSVLAAAGDKRHILELGTGLGFATLWLANGAKRARIDTIESDPLHVEKARANFEQFLVADRVVVHQGGFDDVMPTLTTGGYDMIFFDGWEPRPDYLPEFSRLLSPGSVLVSSNLHYIAGRKEEAETAWAYCEALYGDNDWYTCTVGSADTAVSVRR